MVPEGRRGGGRGEKGGERRRRARGGGCGARRPCRRRSRGERKGLGGGFGRLGSGLLLFFRLFEFGKIKSFVVEYIATYNKRFDTI